MLRKFWTDFISSANNIVGKCRLWSIRPEQEPTEDKIVVRRKGYKRLSALFWFVGGSVFTLIFNAWFIELLPGPTVTASLYGLRALRGDSAGCIIYLISIKTDQPLEYVYTRLLLPTRLNNYKVGWPQESQTGKSDRLNTQVWSAGRNEQGECSIKGVGVENTAEIQAAASGNTIVIHSSKVPPNTTIVGAMATTEGQSSIRPAPRTYTEGAFEYTRLGQVVRKPLLVQDLGIGDAK